MQNEDNNSLMAEIPAKQIPTTQPPISTPPPPHRPDYFFLGLCIIVSVLAGALSGWVFAKANTMDVYVVDVKSIVNEKKRELVEMYKKAPTEETIATADKELSDFLIQLERGIARLGNGNGKIVLLKDIYLAGNAEDMTDALRPKKKQQDEESVLSKLEKQIEEAKDKMRRDIKTHKDKEQE
ncbi:MAG TPA: TrbI F-type domain-containing protein [Syntrophales bacterium]|nr:TrbI F-type domain-containing protein [Syntrophales bacterium]